MVGEEDKMSKYASGRMVGVKLSGIIPPVVLLFELCFNPSLPESNLEPQAQGIHFHKQQGQLYSSEQG